MEFFQKIADNTHSKGGESAKYFKENILKFIRNIIPLFRSFVDNSQSIVTGTIALIILAAIMYLVYKVYKSFPRPWSTSVFLPISGTHDRKAQDLDMLYYKNLAKGLSNYIFDHNLPLYEDVLKGTKTEKQAQLSYINSQIFFHKTKPSYLQLTDFENKNNIKSQSSSWGKKSLEGLEQFFYEVLINQDNKHEKIKKNLIDILTKNKQDFKNNLDKVLDDNIYSFINANNYIDNVPENDYVLNIYGKFVKVKVGDNTDGKYLSEILNIPQGSLKDMLQYNKNKTENNLIIAELNSLVKEYDDVCNEKLENKIYKIINGSEDNSDIINYKRFLSAYGYSGNDYIDSILKLSKTRNKSVNLVTENNNNIETALEPRLYKLQIYQDIIVYERFKTLLKNYEKIITDKKIQDEIIRDCNWHLERLAYAKYDNGENVVYLFTDLQRKRILKITSNILDLINYPLYKTEMSNGLFTVIYLYLSKTDVKKRLELLANYYMSFTELFLAVDKIKEFEVLKQKRDNINIYNEFLKPAIDYFFKIKIYQRLISDIVWKSHFLPVATLWRNILTKLTNGRTYFNCDDPVIAHIFPVCRPPAISLKEQNSINNLNAIINANKESFIDYVKKISTKKDNIENFKDTDVIEHFSLNPFKFLTAPFKVIGQFFNGAIHLIRDIGTFLLNAIKIVVGLATLASNPGKLFLALGGFILWIIGNIIALILTMPVGGTYNDKKTGRKQNLVLGHILTSFFYRTLYLLTVAIFNCVVFALLLLIRVIVTLIVTICDSITNNRASKAFYRWFIACEESPYAWFENSFYQDGNRVEKGLMCTSSCPSGFKVSKNGRNCEKIPDYIPNYCPQASLMRAYRGMNTSGPAVLKEFSLPSMLNESQTTQFIEDFKKNKKEYYEACQNNDMNKYDAVAKSVCSTLEFSQNSNISTKSMVDLCYNAHCRNGKHESFCTKLGEYQNINANSADVNKNTIIKTTSRYILIIATFVMSIYILDQRIDLLKLAKKQLDAAKKQLASKI